MPVHTSDNDVIMTTDIFRNGNGPNMRYVAYMRVNEAPKELNTFNGYTAYSLIPFLLSNYSLKQPHFNRSIAFDSSSLVFSPKFL